MDQHSKHPGATRAGGLVGGVLFCLTLGLGAAGPVAASEQLAQKGGCAGCHTKEKKLVGPAYRDIGAKFKDQKDALGQLSERVRKGSVGVWGQIPMPPSGPDKISDGDLKAVIEWILKGAV